MPFYLWRRWGWWSSATFCLAPPGLTLAMPLLWLLLPCHYGWTDGNPRTLQIKAQWMGAQQSTDVDELQRCAQWEHQGAIAIINWSERSQMCCQKRSTFPCEKKCCLIVFNVHLQYILYNAIKSSICCLLILFKFYWRKYKDKIFNVFTDQCFKLQILILMAATHFVPQKGTDACSPLCHMTFLFNCTF